MDTTPHSLLEKLRAPQADASWVRFVRLYTPVLFSWASRAGLQDSDAADLVQEVFTILVEKLPVFEYDEAGSFRAWLRAVTMNKLRDWKRRQAALVTVTLTVGHLAALEAKADSFWELDYRRELTRRCLEIMQSDFAPRTWQACWEFLTTGQPAAEVGQRHGLSENAVYIAKCRIVRRLREELSGMVE